ncbi:MULTISPECIES: acyl-homoserine-lactone synthase TraI [unclassified Phyllobacterium]|uniref:acyl-homoserine-lactone synthase n=1 Tax=unclassified Phyllobacterium TaxID=2638441 RepID=UPI003012CE47
MLALAIQDARDLNSRRLVNELFKLRARVFSGRLAWNVNVRDRRETDAYDLLDPTYILVISDDGILAGCARLLPATGPTMLADIFKKLLAAGRLAAHPAMVESSRFCVDTSLVRSRTAGTLHEATLTLFAGIIEWSMANGFKEVVTATDVRFERILKRAGWPMRRLGGPCRIGDTIAVAGSLAADAASFDRIRPAAYRSAIVANSE